MLHLGGLTHRITDIYSNAALKLLVQKAHARVPPFIAFPHHHSLWRGQVIERLSGALQDKLHLQHHIPLESPSPLLNY